MRASIVSLGVIAESLRALPYGGLKDNTVLDAGGWMAEISLRREV